MSMGRVPAIGAFGLTVLALLLASCSSEPGASDMRDALHRNPKFQATVLLLGGIPALQGGKAASAEEIVKRSVVEKSACTPAHGMPGYMCDFRWGQARPEGGVQFGPPAKGRFFRTGDGWAVEM